MPVELTHSHSPWCSVCKSCYSAPFHSFCKQVFMSIDLLSVRHCYRPEVSKLFSIHGNRANIEGFVGHSVSVAPAQRCGLGWLCPRKTLLTEMGAGWSLPTPALGTRTQRRRPRLPHRGGRSLDMKTDRDGAPW